jgi:WhiB family redox-sensing transcriptional regulator
VTGLIGASPTPHGVDLSGLSNMLADEDWIDDALCAQVDPEAFFPEKGGSNRDAQAICAKCDVQAQCLVYALKHNEQYGIWGGLSKHERDQLKRRCA